MSKLYVVMAHTNSPIAFNVPFPVAVFEKKKAANAYVESKNQKAARLSYYLRTADDMREHEQP